MPVTYDPTPPFLHDKEEWLSATIVSIEETDGQWGPQFEWHFEVDGDPERDDGSPRQSFAWCTLSYTPRSKLTKWVKAILGEVPEVLNEQDLVGMKVDVFFEHEDKIDPISGEPTIREKLTRVRAAKKASTKQKAPAKKKTVEDDDEAPF